MHGLPSDSRLRVIDEILQTNKKIAIVGGPATGKTTLADRASDRPVIHTDDYKSLLWANVPDAVIRDCSEHEAFVVEGVQVARCLRRGLAVDAVIYLDDVHDADRVRPGMSQAVETVFNDWRRQNRITLVISPDRSAT